MAENIKSISLLDILPSSILQDETVKNSAAAIDWELKKVSELIKEVLLISRIDELPENVIDLLAYQWHVDFYDSGLNVEQKRRLVKTSIAVHKIKGTKEAVEKVVAAVFYNAVVKEWFEYGGEPYYFKISVSSADIVTDDKLTMLRICVASAKNVRSWLDGIELAYTPVDDLEMENKADLFLSLRVDYSDAVDMGVYRYQKPMPYIKPGNWDGSYSFDGSIKYEYGVTLYTANKVYGDAGNRENLYYDDSDSARLDGLTIIMPVSEKILPTRYDGEHAWDGDLLFNGINDKLPNYDMGIHLYIENIDGTEITLEV